MQAVHDAAEEHGIDKKQEKCKGQVGKVVLREYRFVLCFFRVSLLEHIVFVEEKIAVKRNESSYHIGKEEIPAEAQAKAVKQKVYAEGQNGAGGKFQDLPVNAKRILDGVEVTSPVVIDVNGFYRKLYKGDAFFGEGQEHVHLIFIAISGNGQKLRNHFPGKTPEACLGVLKLYTGGEKKYFFGNIVAYSGA